MNILFVTDVFPTISSFINNQIEGLEKLGQSVEVYSRCYPSGGERNSNGKVFYPIPYIYNRKKKWKFFLSHLPKALINNPKLVLACLNVFRFGRDALNLKVFFKILPFIGKKIDIIQIHFGINQEIPILLRKLGWKVPIVTMFHGYDIRLGIEKGGHVYRELFEYGDLFLSISDYNRKNLIGFGLSPNKIIHHPVGIDINLFNYKERKFNTKRQINILTIGRLVWEKGYEYSLPAIKRLLDEKYDVKYTIVGEGYKRKEIEQLIIKLGLEKHVDLVGEKVGKDIVNELDRADIFLLPSIAEALPVVLMEASYSGLPVVATKVGSTNELVIDNQTGVLVESENHETIFFALKMLMHKPEIWNVFGQNGHHHIKRNYDINYLNLRLIKVYKNLLQA